MFQNNFRCKMPISSTYMCANLYCLMLRTVYNHDQQIKKVVIIIPFSLLEYTPTTETPSKAHIVGVGDDPVNLHSVPENHNI